MARGPVIALFNLTATPEPAAHGAFVNAAAGVGPAQLVLALVDESAFRARWPGDERRLAHECGQDHARVLEDRLRECLARIARELLDELYPGASGGSA